MYRGAHSAPERNRNRNRKPFVLLISLVLLIALAAGGTFAYLKANTDPVTNQFTAGTGGTEIHEEKNGHKKTSVIIKNTGSAPSYLRVAVTVNRVKVDEDGISHVSPAPDVQVPFDGANWQLCGDGYYYYKGIAAENEEVQFLQQGGFEYEGLEVNIMAQGIQAAGGFMEQNWNRTYKPGIAEPWS